MVDLEPVLLEREQVGPIVVVEHPALPQLGVALLLLVAILGRVLDEDADAGVDDAVVLPPGVAEVALEELVVLRMLEQHQQDAEAVVDVARLVGLRG